MHAVIDLTSAQAACETIRDDVHILAPEAVKQLITPSKAWRCLGRYSSVDLKVDDARALVSLRPQLAARWLSRGPCRIVDSTGTQRAVRASSFVSDLARVGISSLAWPLVKTTVRCALARLDRKCPTPPAGSGPPLYLRCDIHYGLRAGGSLGHIGGVITGLSTAGLEPVLASVERPCTVPPTVSLLELDPGAPRWMHAEQTALAFNSAIERQVRRAWKQAAPRFIYQRHALGMYAGLRLARRFGVPFVLEYNGPETWVAFHWGSGLRYGGLLVTCEDVVLRRSDLVVTVSDVLRHDLLARGLEAERVVTIPNGVDVEKFHPDRDVRALRRQLGLEGKTVVGFIGTFGPWHGVEELVKAFAEILRSDPALRATVRLLLVGSGSLWAAVRSAVANLGVQDCTIFTGLVPQEAGPDYICLFDVAVVPTVPNPDGTAFFGSPTKLFEYMAAGRAIVASALGQVGELLRHERTGLLVSGGRVSELAASIKRLLYDASLRKTLGAAARCEAQSKHTHAARTQQLLQALRKVIPE